MNGRGRFNYSRHGGFQGFGGSMGDPVASTGGKALQNITQRGAPPTPEDDPLWTDIEGTFQDILGEYANMDLDMPIQPPDMRDPQDQMRYLKDLEALGMSSAPSAAVMGANIREAVAYLREESKAKKEQVDMMMKLLPMLEGNKDLQANIAAGVLSSVMPGQIDIQDKSTFGGLFGEEPGVTQLAPENATEGQLYEGISAMALPQIDEIMRSKDENALQEYFDSLEAQLIAAKVRPDVVRTITEALHREASDRITHEGVTF